MEAFEKVLKGGKIEKLDFSPPAAATTPDAAAPDAAEPDATAPDADAKDAGAEKKTIKVGPIKATRTQLGVVGTILAAVGLGCLLTSKETKQEEGKEEPTETRSTWKIVVGGLAVAAAAVAGVYLWRHRVAAPAPTGQSPIRQ